MPSLTVTLDGNALATVCCDGFDVVTVRVTSTRIDEDFSNLGVTAGSYPDEGESTYLTWVNELPLRPGQQVGVTLSQEGVTSHPGKTIEELFPDEELAKTPDDLTPTHEVFEELRRRPNLRDSYALRYNSTLGTSYAGRTSPEKHGFAFTVLWNSHRPERVSVSLYSFTIDSVEQRAPGHDYAREHLQIGQSVTVAVDA